MDMLLANVCKLNVTRFPFEIARMAVDIAGGLLMVLESGGGAASLDGSDLWSQPLDLERRTPFVAWRRGLDAERVLTAARAILA